jgi:hypothetical protein
MSTIRAATIADLAGTGPTTLTGQTAAKAWFNLNGTGTIAGRASQNVSSYTDNGTGDYTGNFTTALTDANYAAECSLSPAAAATTLIAHIASDGSFNVVAPTVSALRVVAATRGGAVVTDTSHVHVTVTR